MALLSCPRSLVAEEKKLGLATATGGFCSGATQARKHVEEMMRRYKEEVETLREALQIAAETVAQVAHDARD